MQGWVNLSWRDTESITLEEAATIIEVCLDLQDEERNALRSAKRG